MSDIDQKPPGRRPLTLSATGVGVVKQSFSHGRSKQVVVEKKKKRVVFAPGQTGGSEPPQQAARAPDSADSRSVESKSSEAKGPVIGPAPASASSRTAAAASTSTNRLSEEEMHARKMALSRMRAEEGQRRQEAEDELQAQQRLRETESKRLAEEKQARSGSEAAPISDAAVAPADPVASHTADTAQVIPVVVTEAPATGRGSKRGRQDNTTDAPRSRPRAQPKRRQGKLTIAAALGDYEDRQRSLASVKRARERERERRAQQGEDEDQERVSREVVVPEAITVRDLAGRMSERVTEIIRYMLKQGEIVRAGDVLDADTAELVVSEFGHKIKRVSEADVEVGIDGPEDSPEDLRPRPPVVTVMGHVDHGKTSLLDAMRRTDTVSREAGGITQHIGAYRVTTGSGGVMTFIDTPGHAAFSSMRARGATATDIVVLVVAADDGIMSQTVEAINHARSAGVPILVAINKIDAPGADAGKILTGLLQHDVQVEAMGGDVQAIEISALTGDGLDNLASAILLQAEMLELKANPDRDGDGVVIESRIDRGRGPVASILVQRGTVRRGDIVVAGVQWGKIRAILDERGQNRKDATPGMPVQMLGLDAPPEPGARFVVVESEARARDITAYRARQRREGLGAPVVRASLEEVIARLGSGAGAGKPVDVAFVIKGDVHGSVEAIRQALEAISGDELHVRAAHCGVGGISEGDVLLAKSNGAPVIAFNVRGSAQALALADQENVEIRYYSVIYDLIDDVKATLSGLLAPEQRETFVGYAEILEIFAVSKVGKVAGCRVTEGNVRRGCKVRLLRDDVVIHEGELSTLKRFKDEVREVSSGTECGMAFMDYKDMRVGDRIECFTTEEIARTLK